MAVVNAWPTLPCTKIQGRSVFRDVGVAVVLPPLNYPRFLGMAAQLPPQQMSHHEKLIGPALLTTSRVHAALLAADDRGSALC